MTITFDQWCDIIIGDLEAEPGFRIQRSVHESAAVIHEWKRDNLTGPQAAVNREQRIPVVSM